MALENQNFEVPYTERFLQYDDPLVIGAGALILGFAIGSGRLSWLGKETGKIAKDLGTVALGYFSRSLQEHNPELFNRNKFKVTH